MAVTNFRVDGVDYYRVYRSWTGVDDKKVTHQHYFRKSKKGARKAAYAKDAELKVVQSRCRRPKKYTGGFLRDDGTIIGLTVRQTVYPSYTGRNDYCSLRIQVTLPGDDSPTRREMTIGDAGFDRVFRIAIDQLARLLGWTRYKRNKFFNASRNVYFEKWANLPMQKALTREELLYRTDPSITQ